MRKFDVTIIGAGAAGMMCAIQAARRGRKVLLVDHAASAGDKIRISGGGKCNFTNLDIKYDKFISHNPKFMASCLSRYTQWDFIDWVESCGILYHEKTLGQLFCNNSSKEILTMLNQAMSDAGVVLELKTSVKNIKKSINFEIELNTSSIMSESVVIATGGKSIPKMGATAFGYKIAEQFGLSLTKTRPGLVPLMFAQQELAPIKEMSGTSVQASVSCNNISFDEGLLFTHRGLSGPSILQISSYWDQGDEISVNLLRDNSILDALKAKRRKNGKQAIHNALNGTARLRSSPGQAVVWVRPTPDYSRAKARRSSSMTSEVHATAAALTRRWRRRSSMPSRWKAGKLSPMVPTFRPWPAGSRCSTTRSSISAAPIFWSTMPASCWTAPSRK